MIADIPIIYEFIYKDGFYVYDLYKNKILKVHSDHYHEIRKLKNVGLESYVNSTISSSVHTDITKLIRKGYFSNSQITQLHHPLTEYIPPLIEKRLRKIILQVTQNCNFICRYCAYANDDIYNRGHENKYMTFDIAKKAIDYLFSHSCNSKDISINFYGGEPLLNIDLIKKSVEYSKSLFLVKKIKFSMTTNGSILNEKILDFLIENNFNVTISLDGSENIQNSHRKFALNGNNTFDIVYNNIKFIKNKNRNYYDNYVSFNPVIMKSENSSEVMNFFLNEAEMPASKVFLNYADLTGIDYFEDITYNDIKDNYAIDLVNNEQEKRIIDLKPQKISSRFTHGGPCVSGAHTIFISTDGTFYPCEKSFEILTNNIGSVYSGLNADAISSLLNICKITENECKKCWAIRFCSICQANCIKSEDEKENKQLKLRICEYQKKKAKTMLINYINQ